jgi:hypothetical protein
VDPTSELPLQLLTQEVPQEVPVFGSERTPSQLASIDTPDTECGAVIPPEIQLKPVSDVVATAIEKVVPGNGTHLSAIETKPYLPIVPADECVATSEEVRNALMACSVGIVESNSELYIVRHATKELAATNLIPLDAKNNKCKALIRACVDHVSKKSVSNRILIEAVAVLKEYAHEAPSVASGNRFLRCDDAIYVDRSGKHVERIRVAKDGWSEFSEAKPYFHSLDVQKRLPKPNRSGDLSHLFRLLGIAECRTGEPTTVGSESELAALDARLLISTWLVACLDSGCDVPILRIIGVQGSGKSMASRLIRDVVDPVELPLLRLASDQLWVTAHHYAILAFDNLVELSRKTAADLCIFVTGGGLQKRTLFTDRSLTAFLRRPRVILNGIDLTNMPADLLDRTISLRLKKKTTPRASEEIVRDFEEHHEEILGGLFDLLTKALSLVESVKQESSFRLPQFHRYGRAVAVALGLEESRFDEALKRSREQDLIESLRHNPLAMALAALLVKQRRFEGSITKLIGELRELQVPLGFPLDAAKLSQHIRTTVDQLCSMGIGVKFAKRRSKERPIEIVRLENFDPLEFSLTASEDQSFRKETGDVK